MSPLDAIGVRLVAAGLDVRMRGSTLVVGIAGVKPVTPVTRMKKPRKPRRVGERWEDNQGNIKKKTTMGTWNWSKTKKRWIKPDPNKQRILERKRKGGFGIS